MAMNYSGPMAPQSVVMAIRHLIVQRVRGALLRTSTASDALDLGSEYEQPVLGFNAYFAVQNEMLKLDGALPELEVKSKPNANGSAYHAELRYQGIVATISSAQREDGMPRPARFREQLMQARLFDINDAGGLEIAPDISGEVYVEIVYGRCGGELSFVKAVFVTSSSREVMFLYRTSDVDESLGQNENIQESDWFGQE